MEKIVVEKNVVRLDLYLKEKYPEYSRGYLQRLIKDGHVDINGLHTESGHRVNAGDVVNVEFIGKENKIQPVEMPLDVVFEDDDIIVINKRPGVVVHPAGAHAADTLVNGLLFYWDNKLFPFLVHRLDKDTSGLIVVAKNEPAKESLSRQFQNRTVEKKYLTIADGVIKENEGTIDAPLGRSPESPRKIVVGPASVRAAKTYFRVKKRYADATFLEIKPYTGRTHQIRVHLAFIGHSVLGDTEYGTRPEAAPRQMLHAYEIRFLHPTTHKKTAFTVDIPEDFKNVLEKLENEKGSV